MKRLFAVLMCAVLLVACVGCTVKVAELKPSEASQTPAASQTPTTSQTPAASQTPATSQTPAASQTPEPSHAASSESANPAEAGTYVPGTYEVTVRGMGGNFKVEVTFDAESIVSIEAPVNQETENIGSRAIEEVIPAMIKAQSPDVDGYSGATVTSNALKTALTKAIEMATP